MSYEAEVREHAKELGYRLIKLPNTDRYHLAENSWYGRTLDQTEEKLEEIEAEMFGYDEEDEQPSAPPPAPAEAPVVIQAKPESAESDLDAEIAAMAEKIRQTLWHFAAKEWWCHYVDEESPPKIDRDSVDAICPAFAYAWQRGIDTGYAQPVTEDPAPGFPVPDQEWIGLGLDDDREVAWEKVWVTVEDYYDVMRRLERRWVEREVYRAIVPDNIDELVDNLFDEDGDWKSEDSRVYVFQANDAAYASKPTFFTDLILKVDHRGAPDYADGWWSEDDEPEELP